MSPGPGGGARLVVALPPDEAALALLEHALAMAERLEREMVALLVEDARLLASAALPFTRIVSRTGAGEREFDVAATERMLRVVAERARQRLQRVGSAHRVRWRLETAQGLEAVALGAGDVVAFASGAAAWREEPPARLPCPVLLLGRPGGPLVVVHRAGREPLGLARELARRAQLPLRVLALDPEAAAEARAALDEAVPVETCGRGDRAELVDRLRALAPGLVLVEACDDRTAWSAALEALEAATARPAG